MDRALVTARALTVHTVGRSTGRPHGVTVWFAHDDGALYFLAHARDHGRGTDWYRNLVAAGSAVVAVGDHRQRVVPGPFPIDVDGPIPYTLALLEAKYGVGAVEDWYRPTRRIPVRVVPG
jgi:deazaflavin-dependent oxidoreductase (nitroreductase family)